MSEIKTALSRHAAITAALAECETRLKRLAANLAEAIDNPGPLGIGVRAGEIGHSQWNDECRKIYRLAIDLGAIGILSSLAVPFNSVIFAHPLIGPTCHEVMKRWSILAEWCRLELGKVESQSPSEPPGSNAGPDLETVDGKQEFASGPELARKLEITNDAADARLRRIREKYPDCFIEIDHPRANEPKYIYRVADVIDLLRGDG